MLPKVRLILAVMTAALVVAALGFGLFSRNASVFAIGLHSARGAPLERSLPEPPDWKQFIAHAALRRAEELNRLLELPNPEPLISPAESVEQAPAGLPESGATNTPDSTIATPETEPSTEPSDTTEIPAAVASPSPPPPAAETPAAENVASASPARMDEPSPAEPLSSVSQEPEPPAVGVSSVSQGPISEPPAVGAEVSVVPAPAAEPALAETASAGSQRPESEPPPVDVALAVPQPPEREAVPAPAEAAPAQAAPTQDSATTLALVSTSAPEETVEKSTTAAVPLPRPAPPRTNVRHPAGAKAQASVARTKAARVARAVNARAARARRVGALVANPASPEPFSGLYQQSHPSE
jgi:hypothetical protein